VSSYLFHVIVISFSRWSSIASGNQTPTPKTTDEQFTELRAVIDNLASSMATTQGNQGQLTVVVNHLQSKKIVVGDGKGAQTSGDPIASVTRHGHKLLFPTYDSVMIPCHGSIDVSNSSASKRPRTPARSS
jgi:hypothetical protein